MTWKRLVPDTDHMCATCIFWQGDRTVIDAEHVELKMNQWALCKNCDSFHNSKTEAIAGCVKWTPFEITETLNTRVKH